jgi:preprotein translocase subunit SecF
VSDDPTTSEDVKPADGDPLDPDPAIKRASVWSRLYNGETDFDIIGRWKVWFAVSGVLLVAGLGSLLVNGLNLGIDFEGGVVWEVSVSDDVSVADAEDAVSGVLGEDAGVQELSSDDGRRVRVQSADLSREEESEVTGILAELGGTDVNEVSFTSVGPSWGQEITEKAQRALIIFLIAITLYITLRFEFRMAVATLVALLHDILMTVGLYSIFQFPVTPATVIAILTILGYSIYDGIVVFDRIDENTRLVSVANRLTYRGMVNRSMNEVLMRTLNTSITALIPILSLLLLGSLALGATTLQEFGLALFIGLMSGAYSSIAIASPVLVLLKEREPRYREVEARIDARDEADTRRGKAVRTGKATKATPATTTEDAEGDQPDAGTTTATKATPSTLSSRDTGTVQPRGRKVKKHRR